MVLGIVVGMLGILDTQTVVDIVVVVDMVVDNQIALGRVVDKQVALDMVVDIHLARIAREQGWTDTHKLAQPVEGRRIHSSEQEDAPRGLPPRQPASGTT